MAEGDRRSAPRYPVEGEVELMRTVSQKTLNVESQDLSITGIFVKTNKSKKFKVGEPVSLTFYPASGTPDVFVQGEVVRVVTKGEARKTHQAPGIGIRFAELEEEDIEHIKQSIKVTVEHL